MQFTNSNATTQWGFLSATATSVFLEASGSSELHFINNPKNNSVSINTIVHLVI
jgi:hypothetical protein